MAEKKTTKTTSTGSKTEETMAAKQFIVTDEFIDSLNDRLFSLKKIRIGKKVEEFDAVVSAIVYFIRYFNSLPIDTAMVWDRPLSEIPILDEFKDLVMPNSVRYDSGDRRHSDLLVRDNYNDGKPFGDYNRYMNILSTFRNFYKKDASESITYLSALRVDKSLEEVRVKGSCMMGPDSPKVNYSSAPYIPIPLKCMYVLFENNYYNATDVEIVKDWIANIQF